MLHTEQNGNPLRLYVRSIQARNQGARIAVSVSVEDGTHSENRCFLLTAGRYCELNLKKGELSEEELDRLECASRSCAAVDCGENLLSYGANSVQTLTRKIMRHGYSRQEATEAAEYLESIGLINEREDMRREVEKCLRKHWGAERIRGHLWTRGYGRKVMDELPLVLDDVDFAEECAALIRKQYGGWPKEREERNRMVASLYRYGYKLDEIKEAGKRLVKQSV